MYFRVLSVERHSQKAKGTVPCVCKLKEPWEVSRGVTVALSRTPVQPWTPGRGPRRQSWPSRGRSVARWPPAPAAPAHTERHCLSLAGCYQGFETLVSSVVLEEKNPMDCCTKSQFQQECRLPGPPATEEQVLVWLRSSTARGTQGWQRQDRTGERESFRKGNETGVLTAGV